VYHLANKNFVEDFQKSFLLLDIEEIGYIVDLGQRVVLDVRSGWRKRILSL